jgi:hypothetical protein
MKQMRILLVAALGHGTASAGAASGPQAQPSSNGHHRKKGIACALDD